MLSFIIWSTTVSTNLFHCKMHNFVQQFNVCPDNNASISHFFQGIYKGLNWWVCIYFVILLNMYWWRSEKIACSSLTKGEAALYVLEVAFKSKGKEEEKEKTT